MNHRQSNDGCVENQNVSECCADVWWSFMQSQTWVDIVTMINAQKWKRKFRKKLFKNFFFFLFSRLLIRLSGFRTHMKMSAGSCSDSENLSPDSIVITMNFFFFEGMTTFDMDTILPEEQQTFKRLAT